MACALQPPRCEQQPNAAAASYASFIAVYTHVLIPPTVLRVHCVQVVDNWYPGADKASKGVLLVVTAGKEGAISGGDKFLSVSAIATAALQRSELE